MNLLREKLTEGLPLNGTLVSTTEPCMCEIIGNVGYDCVWIDMEHTYMSYKDVLCHLNAAKSVEMPALVRLPQHDLTATKKVLEMGPDGVIFPMAQSAAEIRELMEMTLYPPHGTRGFGPMRAIGYGAVDAGEYAREQGADLCRFVQIESAGVLDEIETVAALPFVDGFIFGPNDLSGALGEFLNVFGEKTVSSIRSAIAVIRRHGKFVGICGGLAARDIETWRALAPDLLFAGADWCFVYEQARQTLALLNGRK